MLNSHVPQHTRIPGPEFGKVELSAFDCRYQGFFSRRVLVFRTPDGSSPDEITHVFTQALRLLVQKVPVLGGCISFADKSVSPTGQSGWKKVTRGRGIYLHTKDLRHSLRYVDLEATKFAPSLLADAELMPIPPSFKVEPYDAADFQLNFIDGGILLSCCISHLLADGSADTEILRLLAGYCKGVQDQSSDSLSDAVLNAAPSIGLDRTAMRGLKTQGKAWSPDDNPAMYIREPGQKMLGPTPHQAEMVKIYRITGDKLKQLKQDANAAGDAWMSSNDAILSVIWRMILVNRIASGVVQRLDEAPSLLFFPLSAQRFPDIVERGFVGNTVCNRVVQHFTQGDVLGDEKIALPRMAAAIRAEISSVTRDTVASYCQFAESAPNVCDFTLKAVSLPGNHAVNVASLLNGAAIFNSDWGAVFGHHVKRLRCTDVGFTGIIRQCHLVLPKMPDGGCEIALTVYVDGIQAAESDNLVRKYFSID